MKAFRGSVIFRPGPHLCRPYFRMMRVTLHALLNNFQTFGHTGQGSFRRVSDSDWPHFLGFTCWLVLSFTKIKTKEELCRSKLLWFKPLYFFENFYTLLIFLQGVHCKKRWPTTLIIVICLWTLSKLNIIYFGRKTRCYCPIFLNVIESLKLKNISYGRGEEQYRTFSTLSLQSFINNSPSWIICIESVFQFDLVTCFSLFHAQGHINSLLFLHPHRNTIFHFHWHDF